MPCILDIVRQPSNPVGRHYTRFLAENAHSDDQPPTTMPTLQSENRLWFPRHNEGDSFLRADYCGSWAKATTILEYAPGEAAQVDFGAGLE